MAGCKVSHRVIRVDDAPCVAEYSGGYEEPAAPQQALRDGSGRFAAPGGRRRTGRRPRPARPGKNKRSGAAQVGVEHPDRPGRAAEAVSTASHHRDPPPAARSAPPDSGKLTGRPGAATALRVQVCRSSRRQPAEPVVTPRPAPHELLPSHRVGPAAPRANVTASTHHPPLTTIAAPARSRLRMRRPSVVFAATR